MASESNGHSVIPKLKRHFRRENLEPVLWCALALISAIIQLEPQKAPHLSSDSFQYLSVARELRLEQKIATPLVHFDTERSHGEIPAPMTWFPPGYPLAIAIVSAAGLSYESSALVISIASFVLVTAGLWHLTRILEPSRWAARAAVLFWLTNSQALDYGISASSEPMFTALGLLSLLFLVHADVRSSPTHNGRCWIAAGAMAGLSYWVRYAGLLWVVAFFLILLAQIAAAGNRKKSFRWPALFSVVCLLFFVLPLMIRNTILVGDWRGGNNTRIATSIYRTLADTPMLLHHLVLGDGTIAQLKVPLVFVAIGLVGVCIIVLGAKPAASHGFIRLARSSMLRVDPWWIVLAVFLIYSMGIAAIATRSVISYSPRMLVPVLPHAIALVVSGIAFLMHRSADVGYSRAVGIPAVLCLLLGYEIGNFRSRGVPRSDMREITEEALRRPDSAGRSLKTLLDQELKPGEVIAATNGQAAGYILGHPTLSLVGRPYSLMNWTEPELRTQLARFGAAHLLIFRAAGVDPVIADSPFLGALAAGEAPLWLQPVDFNADLYIYRVQMRASGAP